VHTQYLVNILNHAGEKIAIIPSWRSLSIEKSINNFSTHTLSLDLDDPAVQYFAKDRFVQVMRSDVHEGMNWYQEYIGFHRTPSHQITEAHNKIFTSYGRSLEDLLNRRSILYYAPHDYTGPADNVMKQIVRENLGSLATVVAGRLRDGVFDGLQVEADSSQAPQWHGGRSYRNVLEVLKEISLSASVDFKIDFLAPTSTTLVGFRFVTGYPSLGDTLNLRFGPEYGNVAVPQYTASATEEVNVLVVAGGGTEAARTIYIGTTPAILESPWNDIELVRDSRNEADLTGLANTANSELLRLGERHSFVFQLIQTPTTLYGRDYHLGDTITVRFGSIVHTHKIVGVRITVNREGSEQIVCDFSDTESPTEAKLIRTIAERLHNLEHTGDI